MQATAAPPAPTSSLLHPDVPTSAPGETLPDPGWYPDPADPTTQRYHSGRAWTSWSRIRERQAPTHAQLAQVYSVAPLAPTPTRPPASGPAATKRVSPAAPGLAGRRRPPSTTSPSKTGGRELPTWARLALAALAVVIGVTLASSAVWQLWGSNWAAARSQAALAQQLQSPAMRLPVGVSLAALGTRTGPVGAPASLDAPAPLDAPQAPPPPAASADPGDGVATIRIDRIGLDRVVVRGTDTDALRRGPGWMDDTAFPGEAGNAVISGHRTTYGSPFRHLDALEPGDRIVITTPDRPDAIYEVRTTLIVAPGDFWVATPTAGVRLTLTTCNPVGSSRERLVVQAELVEGAALSQATPADRWAPSSPS